MESSLDLRNAVVLTTHERSDIFVSALGDGVDLRLNPSRELPLDGILHNVCVSGGGLVVIDEAYFHNVDEMAFGLESFLAEEAPGRTRLVIVCGNRRPGDPFLSHLVTYCGLYDIVFDVSGTDLVEALGSVLRRPNERRDVMHLAEGDRWELSGSNMPDRQSQGRELEQTDAVAHATIENVVLESLSRELCVDVRDSERLKLSIVVERI